MLKFVLACALLVVVCARPQEQAAVVETQPDIDTAAEVQTDLDTQATSLYKSFALGPFGGSVQLGLGVPYSPYYGYQNYYYPGASRHYYPTRRYYPGPYGPYYGY